MNAGTGTPLEERLSLVRALVLDVDGVLTDGRLHYGPDGEEEGKAFHTRDGLALRLALNAGLRLALLTGRRSRVVSRRAEELGIEDVMLGALPKLPVFEAWCRRRELDPAHVAYMGDDLVDVPVIRVAGLGAAVADADDSAREAAIWISSRPGGCGAVRELVELILRAQGSWDAAIAPLLAREPGVR